MFSRTDFAPCTHAKHLNHPYTPCFSHSHVVQDNITRSLDDARAQIQAHVDRLQSLPADQQAAEFAKIASVDSDCSSARKGGDLGFFGRGMMQKSFEVSGHPRWPRTWCGLAR